MKTPNVILLTIDTLRADMLGCYGHYVPLTPNIDRLAATGIRFEQAITGGSWTQAAFPVLLTSTYASMYGGCLGPLSPERPSPIEKLVAHGYATAGFSTSPLLSRRYGYDRGFQHFVDLDPDETDPVLRRIRGGERLLRYPLTHYMSRLVGTRMRPARTYVSAADVTDHLCQWLETTEPPFFAWAHYMDTHWPYHREETLTEPQEIAQAWRDLAHLHGVNWNGLKISSSQRQHFTRLYEEALRYTDAQIGRLLDYLRRLGHLSDTIVVLVSDHGEEFLERGRWGHFESNLHDEILRVPFILHLPDSTVPQTIHRQIRTLDIMPTLLDLCGCSVPDRVEGASLVPLWTTPGIEHDADESISEMWREEWHIVAVRTDMFKFIWNSRRPDQPQLFNLQTDPNERRNVRDYYPQQVAHFKARVDAHLERAANSRQTEEYDDPELNGDVVRRLRDLGYIE